MLETLKEWDSQLFLVLNGLGTKTMDPFWIFITHIESWTLLFILFLVVPFIYFSRRKALWVVLGTLASFVVTLGLKYLAKISFGRIRPNNLVDFAPKIRILQFPSDFSFFSGHASVSFAVTTFMVLALRKSTRWVYLCYLWPVLFSFSRIYVGVHFPSDILAGMCIGFFVALFLFRVFRKFGLLQN